ncbi:unnamed protein product [Colias eurytheme]|nr:unnamed protein product [Colias eurytheme]
MEISVTTDVPMSCDPTDHRRHSVTGLSDVKYATEASIEFCEESDRRTNVNCKSNSGERIPLRKEHRFATWNVRGLLQAGKLTIVDREASDHHISILGLSETHMRGQGHFKTASGNTLYFSGSENKSANGVGFLLPSHMTKYVMGYNPISDRIISLKINAKPHILNILQIYAPTEKAKEEDIDDFYNLLNSSLCAIPNREITIILGDWNAKVGDTKNDDHIRSAVGLYGLGTRNERGQRLIEFCVERNLCITNTCFQHHPRRLYTWTSPGARYRNQIDYIIVNSRWRSSVRNVKTFPGADCGTDHNLLVARFNLRLKAARKFQPSKPRDLDPSEKLQFSRAVENTTAGLPVELRANERWEHFKTAILDGLDTIIQNRNCVNTPKKIKTWVTDSTWELILRRKELKAEGLLDDNTRFEYSRLGKLIKKECRKDKNIFIESICTDIESHALKYQTSDLFKKVHLLSKNFKPKSWIINDKDGNPINDLDDVAERWREYCSALYCCTNNLNNASTSWNEFDLEPTILRSEVTAAIAALKIKKAPGSDHITAEILKSLGDKGIDYIHSICNHIWQHGDWPTDWCKSIILPLHKKGSTRNCGNYRTLALVSHSSKILLHIINNRIRYYLDWQIPQEQAGFVKGKGTREQILNVRQLVEKAYEFDIPLVLCFIDYSKAFDCVDWSCLWKVLAELGVPQHLIFLLQSLYYNSQGVVRVDHTLSKPFKFEKGVRQGCILSPILFNIYGEYIMRRVCEDWDGGVNIGGTKITNLRYADDTTLIANDKVEMASFLDKLESISNELGLTINKAKTKLMVVDRTNKMDATNTTNLDTVDSFVYLGSIITNNKNKK